MTPARNSAEAAVHATLTLVEDPCMCLAGKGLSIVDMGIVNYAVMQEDVAHVSLTFTDPTCLFEFRITNAIVEGVGALRGVREVRIVIEHLPIWTSDRLSPKAKRHFDEERATFAARLRDRVAAHA